MQPVAEGVWHLPLLLKHAVNAYVLGDVLVDAGYAGSGKKVLKLLGDHTITAHALTHAHPDHVGGSKTVVDALGIPFWAPEGDAAAVERGRTVGPPGRLQGLVEKTGGFKTVPIARRLQEGDEVAGFTVIDTPGHSPGHISFWRESDRVLICGDVWFNMNVLTTKPGLRAPLGLPTVDPALNARSQQKLVDLKPDIACFGHGPVMRDAASKLRVFPA